MVVDIDGVLSDAGGRQHHLRGPDPDWRAFFEAGADDPAIEELHALLELLDAGLAICLVTARPARVQELTEVWLAQHDVRWDLLVTRPRGSQGSSSDYKRATTRDLRAYGFDLKLAFEDDPRNVEMFRSEGIHCLYVHSGYYA